MAKSGQSETRTNKNIRDIASQRRGSRFDGVPPCGVGLGIAVKDVGVVTPAAELEGGLGGWKRSARGRQVVMLRLRGQQLLCPHGLGVLCRRRPLLLCPRCLRLLLGVGISRTLTLEREARWCEGIALGGGENCSTVSVAGSSIIMPTLASAAVPVAAAMT